MIKLGVNIDHVATLRQQRKERYPNVLEAARVVEKAGAYGITVHLREDRRHIQETDVRSINEKIGLKLNLEMAATPGMVGFACRVKPASVCLVPEKRQELTTEGGLDVLKKNKTLASRITALKDAGIKVSLFIDPSVRQVQAARRVGADCVELHTGSYAGKRGDEALKDLNLAAQRAHQTGLKVNAGHGLDYQNVKAICKLPHVAELNIGFSIIARAVFVGLSRAVQEMLEILKKDH